MKKWMALLCTLALRQMLADCKQAGHGVCLEEYLQRLTEGSL